MVTRGVHVATAARMRASLLAIALAAACNSFGHRPIDARIDGPPDAYQIPATITVRGWTADPATSFMQAPVAGATVAVFVFPDNTTAATTATSDASGKFTATVATNGHALDLHLVASSPSHVDTHYFTDAIASDVDISLDMLTTTEYAGAYATTGVTQASGTGMIELDAVGYYATGTSFVTQPSGIVKYMAGGKLDAHATSTDDTGRAFVLNAPASTIVDVTPLWNGGGSNGDGAVQVFAGALSMLTLTSPFGGD